MRSTPDDVVVIFFYNGNKPQDPNTYYGKSYPTVSKQQDKRQ